MTIYIDKLVAFLRGVIDPMNKGEISDEDKKMLKQVEENVANRKP